MKQWIKRKYSEYTPDGKMWLTIGTLCLIVDIAIGFLGGINQATFWHGLGFATLAMGFAFLPDAAYSEYEKGRYMSCIVIAAVCLPIGVKAYEQQLTYSAGMRHGEIQAANIVNAKATGAAHNVEETKTNLGIWQARLTALEAQRAAAIKDNPWLTTVKADALRAQIAVIDEKIANEIKGGRGGRAAGCKAVCEKLKDEKIQIVDRIAGIERLEGITAEMASLDSQIKGTKDVLDKARHVADNAEHRDSLNVAVAQTTAQIVNLLRGASPEEAIKTDAVSMRYATIGSAGLGSFSLLVLAPVGFFLANRRKRKDWETDDDQPTAHAPITHGTLAGPHPQDGHLKPAPQHSTLIIRDHDKLNEILARWAGGNEAKAIAA